MVQAGAEPVLDNPLRRLEKRLSPVLLRSMSGFLLSWVIGHEPQVDIGEQFDSHHGYEAADQNDRQPILLASKPIAPEPAPPTLPEAVEPLDPVEIVVADIKPLPGIVVVCHIHRASCETWLGRRVGSAPATLGQKRQGPPTALRRFHGVGVVISGIEPVAPSVAVERRCFRPTMPSSLAA